MSNVFQSIAASFRRWFSALIRKAGIRAIYTLLHNADKEGELFRTMNYGYVDLHPDARPIDLPPSLENDRYPLQLYHYVASSAPIAGRDVLEVGCGRGGGAAYIADTFSPSSLVGLDLLPANVKFCRHRHRHPTLRFEIGDACRLPFPDASFDVVVNVESSHCYNDMGLFLQEVHRVLRPGGDFLFADFRGAPHVATLDHTIKSSGFDVLGCETINENVVVALEKDDARKRALIEAHVKRRAKPHILSFAACVGTKVFDGIRTGAIVYLHYVLRKRESTIQV